MPRMISHGTVRQSLVELQGKRSYGVGVAGSYLQTGACASSPAKLWQQLCCVNLGHGME